MGSLIQKVKDAIGRLRERSPFVDHLLAMVGHYGDVNGSAQAGAVTYFGFLSFFPILALAFFVVGYIARIYPAAQGQLVSALDSVLPGMVGNGADAGQVPLHAFTRHAGTVGIIGVVGLLYSGLGWLSGMRSSLDVMFVMPKRETPNFLVGKLLDLVALILIGVVLIVSVALSGAVANFNQNILRLVGVDPHSLGPNLLVWVIGHLLGIAASTVLLMAMFKLLVNPDLPARAMWRGALLGAVGFEILKSLATFLIANTKSQPAFQAFGVALVLLVWINYFSRLVMYAAAWAHTDPAAPADAGPGPDPAKPARHEPEDESAVTTSDVEPPGQPGSHRASSRGRRVSRLAAVGSLVVAALVGFAFGRGARAAQRSPAGSFANGASMSIDGGWTAR